MISLVFTLLLAFGQAKPEPGKILSTIDKKADFASVRTYAWDKGLEVPNRDVHKIIVAAIDAELASRGLSQAANSQSADALVRYDGLASAYVDLDELQRAQKKDPNAVAPTKAMGSLAISMHRNQTSQRMWLGQTREFVDMSASGRDAAIQKIVARVFETYPKRPKP